MLRRAALFFFSAHDCPPWPMRRISLGHKGLPIGSNPRMFYGWRIVGATFVSLFISVGFLFYSYGVFFPALEAEFGGSRFAISIALAIMNIVMGFSAPFLGRALDSWSIRNIMLIGAIFVSLGFMLASQIAALWQFYLLLGTFLGLGAGMIGQLPSSTLVSNWFIKRRGLALGIATMGVSLSGVVMAPLTTWLISSVGWRTTFMLFGALTAGIVTPLVGLIVVNRPEDMGLHPDGATEEDAIELEHNGNAFSAPYPDFSTRGTFRDRNFWAITIAISLNFFAMGATLTHMIPHAKDLGISALNASFVLTASAGVGVFGKVLFGYIADFVDSRLALLVSMSFQCCGTILLLFAETYPMLVVVGAIFGLGMGGVVPLWGTMIGEYFGRESFGRVMGLMGPCMLPIHVFGVPFAGLVFDLTGSYSGAYSTFIGAYALSALSLLILRR